MLLSETAQLLASFFLSPLHPSPGLASSWYASDGFSQTPNLDQAIEDADRMYRISLRQWRTIDVQQQ